MTKREQMYSDYVARTADKIERKYLVSDSVRDCRLSAGHTPTQRVRSRVGITGGYVAGAYDDGRSDKRAEITRKRRSNRNRARRRTNQRDIGYWLDRN